MYLITTWFGTFLCNQKQIIEYILFPKKQTSITKRLTTIHHQEILPEEKKITQNHTPIVNEPRLKKLGEYNPNDPFFKTITINPTTYGYSPILLQKATQLLAQQQVHNQLQSEDLQLIQMVNALDDLIHTANLLTERLTSWNILPTSPQKQQPLTSTLQTVKNEITNLEYLIETDIQKIAPNITYLIGPLIGARLISHAGGLQHLACLPASTIQILGAEKALFRYKKEGGKPPKHGVIYQHASINQAPRKNRGKIARLYATKLATAAKADMFTHRNITQQLQQEITNRLTEIRNK
jgi:nucleolar protein 56